MILISNSVSAASIPEALREIGKTLVAASQTSEAKQDPFLYAQLRSAYLRAEQLYQHYPDRMITVTAGSPTDARYCPRMRYGFARLTLFSSPGEKPAEVELQDIFVCPHAQRVSLQDLSQILLHEIYHSVGWIDECDTTYYELMSHRLAKKKAHHNAHAARCGWGSIAEYRDVEYER